MISCRRLEYNHGPHAGAAATAPWACVVAAFAPWSVSVCVVGGGWCMWSLSVESIGLRARALHTTGGCLRRWGWRVPISLSLSLLLGAAGFCVIPGTHKQHDAFSARHPYSDEQGDFLPVPPDDPILQSRLPSGSTGYLLRAGAGDLILWDSRTIHCNGPALARPSHAPAGVAVPPPSKLLRLVGYVCMTPASWCPPTVRAKRAAAALELTTSTHWPHAFVPTGFRLPSMLPRTPADYSADEVRLILGNDSAWPAHLVRPRKVFGSLGGSRPSRLAAPPPVKAPKTAPTTASSKPAAAAAASAATAAARDRRPLGPRGPRVAPQPPPLPKICAKALGGGTAPAAPATALPSATSSAASTSRTTSRTTSSRTRSSTSSGPSLAPAEPPAARVEMAPPPRRNSSSKRLLGKLYEVIASPRVHQRSSASSSASRA